MDKDANGTIGLAVLFGLAMIIVATVFVAAQGDSLPFGQTFEIGVHYDLASARLPADPAL